MLQVDGIGLAIGPPAPARLTIGLAKTETKNRLEMKMVMCIVSLSVPSGCLSNFVLEIRQSHRKFPAQTCCRVASVQDLLGVGRRCSQWRRNVLACGQSGYVECAVNATK
jgi:hypothetical protein